ncbi:hypothetical protein GGR56DRAFT_691637 [Xylariaceae sp. FL0804]|nr:hypothetical protein GGR56DRAFT_691637 [Xylariaceae sp. FL0804]
MASLTPEEAEVQYQERMQRTLPNYLKSPSPKAPMSAQNTGIPKSKTFGVFSSITSSFSRASLGTFGSSESRKASNSSGDTLHTATASCVPEEDPFVPSPARSGISGGGGPAPDFDNPRQIHTAQSSAYWTGRFMALQDRFHSELLLPDNMTTLLSAHAERSLVPPSQLHPQSQSQLQPLQPPRLAGTLAASATTGSMAFPLATPAKLAGGSSSPRKAPPHPTAAVQPQHPHHPLRQVQQNRPHRGGAASACEAAALLTDEDNRGRRAFVHLEALCTTAEARRSLRAWQQAYARRVGREALLPRGGSMRDMDDKGRGRSHHGNGSSVSIGSFGSFGGINNNSNHNGNRGSAGSWVGRLLRSGAGSRGGGGAGGGSGNGGGGGGGTSSGKRGSFAL